MMPPKREDDTFTIKKALLTIKSTVKSIKKTLTPKNQSRQHQRSQSFPIRGKTFITEEEEAEIIDEINRYHLQHFSIDAECAGNEYLSPISPVSTPSELDLHHSFYDEQIVAEVSAKVKEVCASASPEDQRNPSLPSSPNRLTQRNQYLRNVRGDQHGGEILTFNKGKSPNAGHPDHMPLLAMHVASEPTS